MTTAAPKSCTPSDCTEDRSVKSALNNLQTLFDDAPRRQLEPEFFEELATELRGLHAQIRIHHAVANIAADEEMPSSPELQDELNRLAEEHPIILGKLDRIIRTVDSMSDRTLEDKEVFFLRGLEVIALTRRHEAEEDRIFFLSIWRDTGGES